LSRQVSETEHHHDRNRSSRFGGDYQNHLDVDIDCERRIIHVSGELFPKDCMRADFGRARFGYRPGHFRHIRWNAADHSRSKSSTISGLRCCHHTLALVTFFPFLRVNASGNLGNGLARLSS